MRRNQGQWPGNIGVYPFWVVTTILAARGGRPRRRRRKTRGFRARRRGALAVSPQTWANVGVRGANDDNRRSRLTFFREVLVSTWTSVRILVRDIHSLKMGFRDTEAPRGGRLVGVIPFSIAVCRPAANSPTVSAMEQKTGASPQGAGVPDRVQPFCQRQADGTTAEIPRVLARRHTATLFVMLGFGDDPHGSGRGIETR